MSYSSLWVMDKDFKGLKMQEFHNSWLFNPVIWDTLSEKHLPLDRLGNPQRVIGFNGTVVWNQINDIMNCSEDTCERVLWELSNEQTFFTKDKEFIAKCVREFIKRIRPRENSLIPDRFEVVARTIEGIDGEKYPYFVIESTSVSDDVLQWFEKYDEEKDDCVERALSELENVVTEFVIIEDEKITKFITNTEFCKR